jgi:hypothetical protein
MAKANKYSTMIDVAFTVEHDCDDPSSLLDDPANVRRVIAAMIQRASDLLKCDAMEASEAFGIVDTYSITANGLIAR